MSNDTGGLQCFARSQAPAWECCLGSSSFPKHGKLELAASSYQPGGWELAQMNVGGFSHPHIICCYLMILI